MTSSNAADGLPRPLMRLIRRLCRAAYHADGGVAVGVLQQISDEYDGIDGIGYAVMGVIDWLACETGLTHVDDLSEARLVVYETTPDDPEATPDDPLDIDTLVPAVAWASRLIAARLRMDQDTYTALISLPFGRPHDATRWLMAVVGLAGLHVRNFRSGLPILRAAGTDVDTEVERLINRARYAGLNRDIERLVAALVDLFRQPAHQQPLHRLLTSMARWYVAETGLTPLAAENGPVVYEVDATGRPVRCQPTEPLAAWVTQTLHAFITEDHDRARELMRRLPPDPIQRNVWISKYVVTACDSVRAVRASALPRPERGESHDGPCPA